MSLLMSGFLQVWFLIASLGTLYSIEKAGRRISFMVTGAAMSAVMVVLAVMLAIDTQTSGIVACVMIFAYQAFYTWGFMAGVWVCGPKRGHLCPQEVQDMLTMAYRHMDQRYCLLSTAPKAWASPTPRSGFLRSPSQCSSHLLSLT